MLQALERSIYYVKDDNLDYRYNIVSECSYHGAKMDFKEVTDGFRKDINIRTVFGNDDNICYEIFDAISRDYDKLLIKELNSLLIVSRKGSAIRITKTPPPGNQLSGRCKPRKSNNVGIIQIDSVLAELNIQSYNSRSWTSYMYYVVGIAGILFLGTKVYNVTGYPSLLRKK